MQFPVLTLQNGWGLWLCAIPGLILMLSILLYWIWRQPITGNFCSRLVAYKSKLVTLIFMPSTFHITTLKMTHITLLESWRWCNGYFHGSCEVKGCRYTSQGANFCFSYFSASSGMSVCTCYISSYPTSAPVGSSSVTCSSLLSPSKWL